jgi:hypothetical protein
MDSIINPIMKTTKGKGVGVHSLACNTLGVKGRVSASRWGLGRVTSKLIIHTDLHKPNNKLVSAHLKPFWCTDEPQANTDSQDSPRLRLGGNHHLPPYSIIYALAMGRTPKCHFFSGLPSWSLEIFKIGIPATFKAHNFFCRPLIEMKFKVKL